MRSTMSLPAPTRAASSAPSGGDRPPCRSICSIASRGPRFFVGQRQRVAAQRHSIAGDDLIAPATDRQALLEDAGSRRREQSLAQLLARNAFLQRMGGVILPDDRQHLLAAQQPARAASRPRRRCAHSAPPRVHASRTSGCCSGGTVRAARQVATSGNPAARLRRSSSSLPRPTLRQPREPPTAPAVRTPRRGGNGSSTVPPPIVTTGDDARRMKRSPRTSPAGASRCTRATSFAARIEMGARQRDARVQLACSLMNADAGAVTQRTRRGQQLDGDVDAAGHHRPPRPSSASRRGRSRHLHASEIRRDALASHRRGTSRPCT